MKNIDLVILAGGRGTRIRNLLGKYPKPMVKFNKKHFLQYILNNVSKYNFNRIIILCGYRSNIFFKKLHKKTINFTKIFCLKEKKLLATKLVNKVVIFEETTPLKKIKSLNPDVLFKGNEYKKKISGKKYIEKSGGKVVLLKKIKNLK